MSSSLPRSFAKSYFRLLCHAGRWVYQNRISCCFPPEFSFQSSVFVFQLFQCLRQVCDQVIHVLDADRQPHEIIIMPSRSFTSRRYIAVCLHGRISQQCLHAARLSANEISCTFSRVHFAACASLRNEIITPLPGLCLIYLVADAPEAPYSTPAPPFPALSALRDFLCVALLTVHAHRKCLDAAQNQKTVKRRKTAVRLKVKTRRFGVPASSRTENQPVYRCVSQILCAAVDYHIRAKINRFLQIRR